MPIRIMRTMSKGRLPLLAGALLLAATPAFAQSARFVTQGAAYAYAEEHDAVEAAAGKFVAPPTRNGAQVVFFRQAGGTRGDAVLSEDGKVLARLPHQAYSAIVVAPGTHTFVLDGSTLPMDLAAGERQYVRIAEGKRGGTQLVPSHALAFLRSRR